MTTAGHALNKNTMTLPKLILFLMILFLVNTFQSLAEFKWTEADGYRYAKVDTGITNIKLTGNADSLLIGGESGAYCLSFNSGKLDTLRNSHLNYITSDAKAYISDVSGSADQFYFPYEVYKISINDLYDEGATGFLDGGDPYARKNRVSHITFDYSMTDSTVFDSYEGTQSWSENHNNNFYYRKVVRKFINSDNFRFYIYYSFDKKETWQDGEKKNTQKISKIKLTNNSNGNITYIPVGTHEEYHNIQADFNNGSSKVAVSNKNQILVYSTQNLNREFSVLKLSLL